VNVELAEVDTIVKKAESKKTQLIGVLQDVQRAFGYLPFTALSRIAETLEIPLQQIYNVATFYKAFSLKPRGKHRIAVCLGTACHVRGGQNILEQLERELGIKEGGTTEDGLFSLEAVRCIGACSLAPAVMIDEKVYGRVRQDRLHKILNRYRDHGDGRETKKSGRKKKNSGRKA
jgi:NADH-quinone oxidoreductase subunit E